MLRRWRTEIIAFAVALVLGVGVAVLFGVGRRSEEDRVRNAATLYLDAFAADDPVAVCGAISPVARVQLQLSSTDCATSAKTAIQKVPQPQRDALRTAKLEIESVKGSEARVRFSPKLNGSGEMHLIKRNDTWFVNP